MDWIDLSRSIISSRAYVLWYLILGGGLDTGYKTYPHEKRNSNAEIVCAWIDIPSNFMGIMGQVGKEDCEGGMIGMI